MISTLHCQEDAALLTRSMTSDALTVVGMMSTSTWLGTRLKSTLVTPGMVCKTWLISASLPGQPDPLSVRGRRSLTGGVAQAGREMETLTTKNPMATARRDQMCRIPYTLFCEILKAAPALEKISITYTMLRSFVEVSGDKPDDSPGLDSSQESGNNVPS